jgi:hypothetical protein
MTPLDAFMSVFEPSTLAVSTFLGIALAAFFWSTLQRVTPSCLVTAWLPALTFMVIVSIGRYIDGSTLWPAWLAAGCLWTWAMSVCAVSVWTWRRVRDAS